MEITWAELAPPCVCAKHTLVYMTCARVRCVSFAGFVAEYVKNVKWIMNLSIAWGCYLFCSTVKCQNTFALHFGGKINEKGALVHTLTEIEMPKWSHSSPKLLVFKLQNFTKIAVTCGYKKHWTLLWAYVRFVMSDEMMRGGWSIGSECQALLKNCWKYKVIIICRHVTPTGRLVHSLFRLRLPSL